MAQPNPPPPSPAQSQPQSSSRLNRLLTLLDTGSTQQTRFAAAKQIGDIARCYPNELTPLLLTVSHLLRSRKWDTRVASAKAIGSIALNSAPSPSPAPAPAPITLPLADYSNSMFRSFDINKVLEFGVLLASGGQEYDVDDDCGSKGSKERLARQKKNLRRRLGLDLCEQFMDVSDMIKDEDLIDNNANHNYNFNYGSYTGPNHNLAVSGVGVGVGGSGHYVNYSAPNHNQAMSVVGGSGGGNYTNYGGPNHQNYSYNNQVVGGVGVGGSGGGKKREGVRSFRSQRPSARELNLLKRKAKADVKPLPKVEPAPPPSALAVGVVDSTTDEDGVENEGEDNWPFLGFVERLLVDMFDPVWEFRHGSIMALREILTYQGAYAGVSLCELNSRGKVSGVLSGKVSVPLKREREIDLNMQIAEDESLKKPKLEGDVMTNIMVEQNGESSYVVEEKVTDVKMNNVEITSENQEVASSTDCSARTLWLRNCEFLQDCAICFLCVLSLDRFGDYVSDQVVAPVRETCAQALGAVFKYMAPELVRETMNILLLMQERPEWEIRHGSLLGIKYLIAVRQEMLSDLLGFVLPACKAGLGDPDDDVRAVAADALIPAASLLVARMDQTLHSIVMLLWDILLDLDDLSPSTSSVMNLLAEIYTYAGMSGNLLDALSMQGDHELDLNEVLSPKDDLGLATRENPYVLSALAPRLWPFMRHSITSVRYSAIRTLERLLEARYKRQLSEPCSSSFWPSSILGDTLQIVFQNLLLESNDDILMCTERVWKLLLHCPITDLVAAAGSHISSWLELATTAYGSELNTSKMFWPVASSQKGKITSAKMRAVKMDDYAGKSGNLGASKGIATDDGGESTATSFKIVVGADSEKSVTLTRVLAASALGVLASKWPEESLNLIINPLWNDVTSLSGVRRQVSSMVLISWSKEMKDGQFLSANGVSPAFFERFKKWLLDLLSCTDPSLPTKESSLPYDELSRTYSKMRSEASHLFHTVEASGMFSELLSTTNLNLQNLGLDDAVNFASNIVLPNYDSAGENPAEKHVFDDVESSRQRLLTTIGYLKCVQANLHVTVSSLMAAAIVWFSDLPSRLNQIILPLMASLRREQEEILQQKTAEALAELIGDCIERKPGPNDKLIKNVCSLTCMDHSETPQAGIITSVEVMEEQDILSSRSMAGNQKSRGRSVANAEDRSRVEGYISRRGAELALKHLCKKFGPFLFDKIPKLWDCLSEVLRPINPKGEISSEETKIITAIESVKDPQLLINNIQVVRSIAPLLDEALNPKLLTLLPCIFRCIRHSHVAVRLAACRCITTMAKSMIVSVMASVVENAVPMLGDAASIPARHGAGMLINLLVQGLGVELVPYAPLLVVPLLRCMSDSDASVRQSVTRSFAAIVPLLPLARGLPPPAGIRDDLLRDKDDAKFLEQLLDNSSIDDYTLHTDLKVTLRRYQQEGINWLAFLKRFKLHGILCDDMGLGKTLQASAIVASDIVEHDLANKGKQHLLPSIIVCPSTLVGHWGYEIEKFIDQSVISSLQYLGSCEERVLLRSQFSNHNVIITSYDVVRKDVDFLGQCMWNYCILDEGHIIKNCRSKITTAVKQLKAQNRLILSGTPIQNNILDLWSLFDFLMPGFLGTERQFQATYGKPLLAARDPKCSAKDAEAGALAMEALHKQVMPFLLRRTKDEVLSDLPEKIIQDRYCDLSPVQLKLYEQFSSSNVKKEISGIVSLDDSKDIKETNVAPRASSHIFQALQYLLKLCSHPLLVASDKAADTLRMMLSDLFPGVSDIMSELHHLHHSPKLIALQEILEECGIGVDTSNSDMINVGQHRVLIFAQHKALLDIIERDLFRAQMRNVTYLRLDGSVATEKRFEIVKAFNSDPTIDVLLLTTHVGGLGLNLTSADTLVFMEHDWNPMRDLQAMDRAHRLGQKKVVNVYRLIMRGTLEEKVMSLQKFKVSVANSVINSENASLKTMNTDQLLDLFTPADNSRKGSSSKKSDGSSNENKKAGGSGKGLKAILTNLDDLWDQSQYTEEYNLDQFLSKLNG